MNWSESVRRLTGARTKSLLPIFPGTIAIAIALAILTPGRALADYTCELLDVPGAAWTQVFQINAAGQVAAGSSLGAWVYTGAGWQQVLPPDGSGIDPADVGALGINDYGVVVGGVGPEDGSSAQGFIASSGTFRLFSTPFPSPITSPRSVGNNGVVVGTVGDLPVGFIYNPLPDPAYPPGFTLLAPALPDGTAANQLLLSGMNGLGQFVGSVRFPGQPRFAFLYDPGWRDHGRSEVMTLFRFGDLHSAARGINDFGRIVGFVLGDDGGFQGILRTNLRDRPLTCPGLPGVFSLSPQSINNRGVVSGVWDDSSTTQHGFIAYPDPADDLADLLQAAAGAGRSLESLARLAQASFAAGRVQAACLALAAFRAEVQLLPARRLAPELARAFTAEARAIAAEVGCP